MKNVIEIDGKQHVILFDTCIVSFDAKTVTLRTGGWRTAITKRRMNEASQEYDLGFELYQKGWKWYLKQNGNETEFFDDVEFVRVAT